MSATTTNDSKSRICQGEIFYIMPYGETSDSTTFYGGRPAIVISNDMVNEYNGVVSVIFLTRHLLNKLPTHVSINATPQRSWAICDQITTVSKKRIGKYIGQCSQYEMENIKKAVCVAISTDIDNLNTKSIEETLTLYAENLKAGATDDEISEYPIEDFETPESETLSVETKPNPAPAKTLKAAESVKSKETDNKSVPENSKSVDTNSVDKQNTNCFVEQSADIIKIQTERDIYKNMYEQLLGKIINK